MSDIPLITPAVGNLPMAPVSTGDHQREMPLPASSPALAPAAEQLPVRLELDNLKASFDYDRQLQQIIITLRREDSGEVVRQIPAEHVLRMLAGVMETVERLFDRNG